MSMMMLMTMMMTMTLRRSYLFVSALLEAGPGSPTTNLCQQTIITIKSVIRPTIPNYYHYCQNPTMVGF